MRSASRSGTSPMAVSLSTTTLSEHSRIRRQQHRWVVEASSSTASSSGGAPGSRIMQKERVGREIGPPVSFIRQPPSHRGKSVAFAHALLEWAEQVRDAVRVVADKTAIRGEHRVTVPRLDEHLPHLQHLRGTLEDFLYRSLRPDRPRVQLAQYFAHVTHALDETIAWKEIAVERLDRSARE